MEEEAAAAAAVAGDGGGPAAATRGPRNNEPAADREDTGPEDEAGGRRSKRPRPAGEEPTGPGERAADSSSAESPRDGGPSDGHDPQRQPGPETRAQAAAAGPRTRSASGRLPRANGLARRPDGPGAAGGGGRCKAAEPSPPPPPPELGKHQADGEGEGGESDPEQEAPNPSYELQQGRRILSEFLLDKHKNLTAPFAQAGEAAAAGGGSGSLLLPPQQQQQPVWLHKMEEKFQQNQYLGITDFVADFRLMLESCYRLHGVDHWLSRQAQKLEMMLEQKLTLLSRPLREKTTIAVTSKGRYGLEEERGAVCTSTRRRSMPRSLGGMSTGVTESIMIQALRQEEQQRAREEKRLREQERKEAEEAIQKEIEEWEKNLRALAEPTRMETLWEIPAIGHFLCLAQQILNLPEIVYFDLERCLLMPQCSGFLAKIMTSLLSPHHRRATLHRKPPLPYKMWEAALKRRVLHWYAVVSQAENHNLHAEKLGLSPQFFCVLGETSPLEMKAFHQLPFYKRAWLLKGLCDYVYETQKEVQDAVLAQPIHECREVILGYDSHENAYVHFPQFCGADLRIYKQSPLPPPEFPIPTIKIHRMSQQRSGETKSGLSSENHESPKSNKKEPTTKTTPDSKKFNEGLDSSDLEDFYLKVESDSQFLSQEGEGEDEIKFNCECKIHRTSAVKKENVGSCKENLVKPASPGEVVGYGEPLSPGEIRITENGEFCTDDPELRKGVKPLTEKAIRSCKTLINGSHSENLDVSCLVGKINNISAKHFLGKIEELEIVKLHVKKKKKKKKKLKDAVSKVSQLRPDMVCQNPMKIRKPGIQKKSLLMKKKTKHKKHKSAKKPDSEKADEKKKKLIPPPLPTMPQFQLICTSLDELRELIAKMEGELKELESNKKKSEKWFFRRQALKDLHGTLGRLLNELLPWEQKLIKAFQRNRDLLPSEEMDGEFIKDILPNEAGSSNFADHQEIVKKECSDLDEMMQPDLEIPVCKPKPIRRECSSKETQKQTFKNPKKQIRCSDLDECWKESPPCKKTKLSTNEAAADHNIVNVSSASEPGNHAIESKSAKIQLPVESVTSVSKPDEHSVKLDASKGEMTNVSRSVVQKGTKPIQALLAKHNGNKVTLTSQISSSVREASNPEKKITAVATHPSPAKPCLPPLASSKGPLQMVYKMPDGSCVPIDLSSGQIKIAVQPVIDAKTGERIMQQVLIVPKNLLAQQQDGKSVEKESPPKARKELEKRTSVGSQTADLGHSPSIDLQSLSPAQVQSQISNLRQGRSTAGLTTVMTSVSQPTKVVSSSCNFLASSVIAPQGRKEVSAVVTPSVTPSNTRGGQSTIQPVTPTKTQSRSISNTGTAQSFNSPQSNELSETKQELKTVCIRDSQSILVMTRGGNTGVVKVQSNSDQNSPNSITPRPIFTFLPEVQNLVVSKTQPLSPLTSFLVPAQTSHTNIGQLPVSSSLSSVSLGLNQLGGESIKLGSCNTVNNAGVVPVHVPLPTVLSTVSESSTVRTSTHNALNLVSGPVGGLSSEGPVQNKVTAQAPSLQFSLDTASGKQLFLSPPECNKSGGSTFLAGTAMPKLVLVPNPPATPCGTGPVSMAPTNAQPQKLVLMSPSVSSMSSSSNLVLTKPPQQQLAPPLNTTQMAVKNADPCQVVLVPYTGETPIKGNSLPGPFQVKEVKKGNPAHLIRNSIQKIPGISIVPTMSAKSGEGLSIKNTILPTTCVSTSAAPSVVMGNPSSTSFGSSIGIKMCVRNAYTVATTATGATLPTPTFATFGSLPTALLKGNDNMSGSNQGMLSTRLPVAISTVKAEHLASSMLLASAQPKMSHQSLTPSLSLPITTALPNPITITSKVVPTNTQPISTAFSPQITHFSKDSCQTIIRFPSPNTITSPTNTGTVPRFAAVQAAPRLNTSTIANVLPPAGLSLNLAHPTTVHSLTKHPVSTNTVTAAPSLIQPVATVPSSVGKTSGPLNESCIRQKIVINTSTPLAPGTQILINNHRFVVPPQGLGSGSHVLLISNTLKPSSSQAVNLNPATPTGTDVTSACQKAKIVSAIPHRSQSSPSCVVPPEKLLQNRCAQSAAQTVTAVSRSIPPTTGSMLISSPTPRQIQTAVCKLQAPTSQSATVLPVDTSFSKLLVSPEGAVLNAINTVVNPVAKVVSQPSLTHVLGSSSANAAVVFPAFKASEVVDPNRSVSASSNL
ncbi:putative bromodomain-containing protein 10 isoform X2 [Mustelus asterias]